MWSADHATGERLERSTAWCPVVCHSCGTQERVRLASHDGATLKEALAKRVKVCSAVVVRQCACDALAPIVYSLMGKPHAQ